MATNMGPQEVQCNTYTSSLYNKLKVLKTFNIINKNIIIIINGKKKEIKSDININNKDITGKRNNKEKGKF